MVLIFLVLAAPSSKASCDPLYHPALGSVPLAMFGALIFTSMQIKRHRAVPFWTNGL